MNQNRVDELKQNLNNDVYKKMDALERLREDTLTSTEKLVDILDGYMAKLDDFAIEEEITTMEVISNDEVEIEVNEDDMLRAYNEKIHDFSLETLTELLSKGEEVEKSDSGESLQFEEQEINITTPIIDEEQKEANQDKQPELDSVQAGFTQTITTPREEQIADFEIEDEIEEHSEVVVKEKPEKNPEKKDKKKDKNNSKKDKTKKQAKKKKNNGPIDKNPVDMVLAGVIIILIAFIVYSVLTMM